MFCYLKKIKKKQSCILKINYNGGDRATLGVMVSTSAFLSGFESRLGFEFSSFRMWHFLKLVVMGFLRVFGFPPLLRRLIFSANKIKLKVNAI